MDSNRSKMKSHQTAGAGSINIGTWSSQIIKPAYPLGQHRAFNTSDSKSREYLWILLSYCTLVPCKTNRINRGFRADNLFHWNSRCEVVNKGEL